MIGPATDPAYLRELQQEICTQQLQSRVRIIPGLPPGSETLRDAYAAADIMILPSRHEPFGIVVLEAWAAGKPVLCSDIGGLRHLVQAGEGGYRFADLAEAVRLCRFLREQPELRMRLGLQGQARVLQSYTWEHIGARLRQLYQTVSESYARKV
jgi:glycosyltransferase involved in cell wall biosynthesis